LTNRDLANIQWSAEVGNITIKMVLVLPDLELRNRLFDIWARTWFGVKFYPKAEIKRIGMLVIDSKGISTIYSVMFQQVGLDKQKIRQALSQRDDSTFLVLSL